jgi:hypothetical protein
MDREKVNNHLERSSVPLRRIGESWLEFHPDAFGNTGLYHAKKQFFFAATQIASDLGISAHDEA